MTDPIDDPSCDVAHGHAPSPGDTAHRHAPSPDDAAHGYAPSPDTGRTLVAVFASPVAEYLLRYAGDAVCRPVLVEPDPQRAAAAGGLGVTVASSADGYLDDTSDVVLTDHHRPELGLVLRDALASKARWVGIMGNPRHPAPHIPALTELGVPEADIDRVHRAIVLT